MLEEAENYLLNGNIRSYQEYGFGFYVVVIKETQESIGICGIVKREGLEDVDIGFAFFQQFMGKGYGYEPTYSVLNFAQFQEYLSFKNLLFSYGTILFNALLI